METARDTARQVAESLSPQELRKEAKKFRVNPEDTPAEDFAQLLEYIADLREALERFIEGGYGGTKGNVCMWCGSETRELHNRVCRLGNAEALICKSKGGRE